MPNEPSGAFDLDHRPVIVALAGPNGAGKTTFYNSHLRSTGLRFLNADLLARELEVEAYTATRILAALRNALIQSGESFIFETVFSDPVGDKLSFLKHAAQSGYTVVLCYIGVGSARVSEQRVGMRVSQGGHDVPIEKLRSRYPRTLKNLQAAIADLPFVWVFDNDDLGNPFKRVAVFRQGRLIFSKRPVPRWLRAIIPAGE